MARNGEVFYAHSNAIGTPEDHTNLWRLDPSLNTRSLVTKQKGYYIRGLQASNNSRYLAFHREPFMPSVFIGAIRHTTELAVCDTRTGKITILAKTNTASRQNTKATFPAQAPIALYTEN
jgi:hypothetical protein